MKFDHEIFKKGVATLLGCVSTYDGEHSVELDVNIIENDAHNNITDVIVLTLTSIKPPTKYKSEILVTRVLEIFATSENKDPVMHITSKETITKDKG